MFRPPLLSHHLEQGRARVAAAAEMPRRAARWIGFDQ